MRLKKIVALSIAFTEQENQIGFKDENGLSIINDAHKIRITLSNKAYAIIKEDMDLFEVPTPTEFINTVFDNFKKEAKASLVLYLQQRRIELDRLFTVAKLDEESKRRAIEQILSKEQEAIQNELFKYKQLTGKSKLYHINKNNIKYLEEYCEEGQFYDSPGLYIRFIIEEYCALPFIERTRFFMFILTKFYLIPSTLNPIWFVFQEKQKKRIRLKSFLLFLWRDSIKSQCFQKSFI